MRLSQITSPPFDAHIDVPWGPGDVARAIAMVVAATAAVLAAVSLIFDGPTPLWLVLGATLGLDGVMLKAAIRLGPGRPAALAALAGLLGPRRLPALPLYGWASLTFGTSLVLSAVYVTLAGAISNDLVPPPLPEGLDGPELRWLTFIVVVLVGPFAEEVFFRGFLFAGLLRRFGLPAAVLLSSLVFGAAHLDIAVIGPAFVSGSAFALVYWRTGALWPVILAHTAQNAIAFALSG
jgi:membrane protease YdiL (CAAX protease family)